jgi:hypothetical protein
MMVDYSELKASQLKQLLQGMDKSSADVDLPANVQLSIPIKSFAANNIRCGRAGPRQLLQKNTIPMWVMF